MEMVYEISSIFFIDMDFAIFLFKKKKSLICFNLNACLAKIIFANLFYYSTYFCYFLWVLLHFLVLLIDLTILFQLIFIFIYSTFSKKISVSAK